MKRYTALLAVLCLFTAVLGHAQSAPTGVRGWFLKEVNSLEKKYLSLAESMPAEKYTWRPGEGVRSISEVHLHVAIANMRMPTAIGIKPPAGIEPKGFEKSTTEKAKVIEYLKQSFEHLRSATNTLTDEDMNKELKFRGQPAIYAEVLAAVATHMHEHLGQQIAYARFNKVVPPWSEEGARPAARPSGQ